MIGNTPDRRCIPRLGSAIAEVDASAVISDVEPQRKNPCPWRSGLLVAASTHAAAVDPEIYLRRMIDGIILQTRELGTRDGRRRKPGAGYDC